MPKGPKGQGPRWASAAKCRSNRHEAITERKKKSSMSHRLPIETRDITTRTKTSTKINKIQTGNNY